MDAEAKKKAIYRARLNAQKQDKQRIDSPLVRYNEHDQPVCRVCNIALKSDSLWPAHQASRKHHEAIKNVKAKGAAAPQANNVKPESSAEFVKLKEESERSLLAHNEEFEPSTALQKTRQTSQLPSDFFDNHKSKRQKDGNDVAKPVYHESHLKANGQEQTQQKESTEAKSNHMRPPRDMQPPMNSHTKVDSSQNQQTKGAPPEGFFDNEDADLRARGIKPKKLDIKDEYKEFEKLIQEDLQQVDNRLEEEEYDAADMIEVAESVEQRTYRERVEILKRKKMELKSAKSSMHSRNPQLSSKDYSDHDSSSDDDSDDDAVDWRAKHL